jgi:hypothetical protein
MKVTCLSILLLVTSAVAFPNGVMQGDRRRRTRGVPVNNRALATGDKPAEKGSKGMGGMSMKGKAMKEKGKKGCQSVKFKSSYSDLSAGSTETAVGETTALPLYDYYTDEPLGTYTESATIIFVGGEGVDCTFTGSFNLDVDASLEYPFVSQVMVAGTCLGLTSAITGGTGKYACASGELTFIFVNGEDSGVADLTICNTCA